MRAAGHARRAAGAGVQPGGPAVLGVHGGREHRRRRHVRALPAPQAGPGGRGDGARARVPARSWWPRVRSTLLVRRAARRLGLQAALLGAGVVVLLSAAAVIVVVQGQHRAAVDELHVAAIRADDIDDPPAWTTLAIHGPPGDRRAGV